MVDLSFGFRNLAHGFNPPVYRADTLACILNRDKLDQVRALVHRLRTTAEKEANHQWQGFFRSGW